MFAVVHINEGLLYGVYLYEDENEEEARGKQERLAKECSDPLESFVTLVRPAEVNTGDEEEFICSLPPYDDEEEEIDE